MILKRVNVAAYQKYAKYHYVRGRPVGVKATYEAIVNSVPVGCLVVCFPFPQCRGRNGKMKSYNVPTTGERRKMLRTNREVERIARIVVIPKWRRKQIATTMIKRYLRRSETKYVEIISTPKLKKLFLNCKMIVTEYINCKNDRMIHAWKPRKASDRRRTSSTSAAGLLAGIPYDTFLFGLD